MKKLLTLFMVAILVISFAVVSSFAAGSQVTVLDGTYTEIYNVTFAADTDTYYSMTHGLGSAPDEFTVTALDANCLSGQTFAVNTLVNSGMPYINGASDVGASSVGIAKYSATGSKTCRVRVLVRVIHSLIK